MSVHALPAAPAPSVQSRLSEDEAYLRMASVWAERSYATKAKVGALLVKDRTIISDGFNGMPRGMPNDEVEIMIDGRLRTNPLVIHAEANCFDKLSKSGSAGGAEGATLYVTTGPCLQCAKRILNNRIARVVYRTAYKDQSPVQMLRDNGIVVEQLAPS